jgi:hypothetical protein
LAKRGRLLLETLNTTTALSTNTGKKTSFLPFTPPPLTPPPTIYHSLGVPYRYDIRGWYLTLFRDSIQHGLKLKENIKNGTTATTNTTKQNRKTRSSSSRNNKNKNKNKNKNITIDNGVLFLNPAPHATMRSCPINPDEYDKEPWLFPTHGSSSSKKEEKQQQREQLFEDKDNYGCFNLLSRNNLLNVNEDGSFQAEMTEAQTTQVMKDHLTLHVLRGLTTELKKEHFTALMLRLALDLLQNEVRTLKRCIVVD